MRSNGEGIATGAAAPATTAPVPRRVGELVGIQYLRGVAAMMVVVYHLAPQLERMGRHGGWPVGLSGGVDIFFVISGFIMWATTCGRPVSPLAFWRRRITRIVPLYWIVTTLMVALMLAAPAAFQSSRFDPRHVLASYLFVPWPHPVKGVMEPVVMPGWTLDYEMAFYLLFGLFLPAPPRLRLAGVTAVLLLAAAAGWLLAPPEPGVAAFYTSSILIEFAFGMALGEIATRSDRLGRFDPAIGWLLAAGGIAGVVVMGAWPAGVPRAITGGVPAAAAVAGMLIVEAGRRLPRIAALRIAGDASYSIYLTQLVTLSALAQGWRRLHLDQAPGGWIGFCLAGVAASAVVGWLCYRGVERPLIGLFRETGRRGVAVRAASA